MEEAEVQGGAFYAVEILSRQRGQLVDVGVQQERVQAAACSGSL